MISESPQFVMLKAINGEPMLVNITSIRTVTTINFAGDEVGVISFDKAHEVVLGSSVQEIRAAIETATAHLVN